MRKLAPILFALLVAAGRDGDKVDNFTLDDTAGKKHTLYDIKGAKAVVLVFLGTECPMANRYVPRLIDLQKACRDVAILGVNSNALETVDAIAKHAKDMGVTFPVLLDRDHKVADALKVKLVPTALLLDASFVVRYRGLIDDNKSEDLVKQRHLRDAIDAVLAGKDVAVAETEPVGCQIQRTLETKESEITYASHVAKILNERCVSCHRPGQVAPFSLTTYDEARRWARDTKRYVLAGAMPPWKPVNRGMFHDERVLTKEETDALCAWADAGAPKGDMSKAPAAPKFAEGWMLGEPDLVLEAPEYEVAAEGDDEYRCFVLPTDLPDDQWIQAVEVRPGNFRVVHHVIAYVDTNKQAEKLDAADPKPGYRSSGTGPGFMPTGEMSGWAPGNFPRALPDGVGRFLKKGARVVMEMHYHKNGRKEKDRSRIGLHFAKKPVTQRLDWLELINYAFSIPPGKERHKVTARHTLRSNVVARSIMPHMHLLGREARVEATFPDGEKKTLIEIKDWDFNWQDTYHFKEPLKLPKGTKLYLEMIYDNSTKNPNNPRNPPKSVGWGEQTSDEMCIAFLSFTKDLDAQEDK